MNKAEWIARRAKAGALRKLRKDYVNWQVEAVKTGKTQEQLKPASKPTANSQGEFRIEKGILYDKETGQAVGSLW